MTILGWNYFIHEEQRWVGDAVGHLVSNPDHTITERFADDLHLAGISGMDYTPDDTYVYLRTDGILHKLAISGSNLVITTSGVDVIAGDGQYLALSGGTLTGDLILNGDPTVDDQAANKKYVDDQISALSGSNSSDLTAYSGYAEGAFVNVSGDTMTGFLTLSGDPTLSGHASNKYYVDSQIAAGQPTVQVDFTTGTDLDTTQNTLPVSGATEINTDVSVYTVNATDITINETGYYKVTWNVEGIKIGGGSERRILQVNLNHNGSQLQATSGAAYVRDATNNHGSVSNSYIVEVSSVGQTVGIRTQQTGSGGGSGATFTVSAGHVAVERVGSI